MKSGTEVIAPMTGQKVPSVSSRRAAARGAETPACPSASSRAASERKQRTGHSEALSSEISTGSAPSDDLDSQRDPDDWDTQLHPMERSKRKAAA